MNPAMISGIVDRGKSVSGPRTTSALGAARVQVVTAISMAPSWIRRRTMQPNSEPEGFPDLPEEDLDVAVEGASIHDSTPF